MATALDRQGRLTKCPPLKHFDDDFLLDNASRKR
jgi:hypothetical protein